MNDLLVAKSTRVPAKAAVALLALCGILAPAQSPAASPLPGAIPLQQATAGNPNDALLSKATALYNSTAKAGLREFDCQIHPDWNRIMTSSRKGVPVPAGDTRLALLSTVDLTLHARLKGSSTLDWQVPVPPQNPLDPSSTSMLNQAHRDIENTLVGLLKLWIPLVDGSVAESFGADDADVAKTDHGYSVRSKGKGQSLTEEFDRDLILKTYKATDSGSTVNIAPSFQPSAQGLLLIGFRARIHPAGVPANAAQEMNVALQYQTVSGIQIPGSVSIEIPNLVQMDFKFDACVVNPE